jgi:hypothetical protein
VRKDMDVNGHKKLSNNTQLKVKEQHFIYFVCSNYNPVSSSFVTNFRVCNKSSTTGATSGA